MSGSLDSLDFTLDVVSENHSESDPATSRQYTYLVPCTEYSLLHLGVLKRLAIDEFRRKVEDGMNEDGSKLPPDLISSRP